LGCAYLAIDAETGEIDPAAPFMVIPRRRELLRLPGRSGIYEQEPGVIEQFRPGEREAQFEAEWSKQEGGWKFGKRVTDESRSRKSAQDDKWSFCLTTGTLCLRIRRDHDKTTAPEPHPGLQG
jgi:hypothetical protein